ncbi:MAG: hypothetical protein A2176_05645 [Spirochaetes bacterium RBG_13_51_14]|nr:MAG: hypothetical protein A2176_05645 [Spirochaetes bacterium RBG_13_51_14]
MADKIIQTFKTRARRPGVSFTLSLFFTGLGQMYNGNLVLGAAFCLMRAVVMLAVPASLLGRRPSSGICGVLSLMFVVLLVTAAAPAESLVRARRMRELPFRIYNSALWYSLFALANAALTAVAILIMASFFSIVRVEDNRSGPLLEQGDYLLVERSVQRELQRGELAVLDDGTIARVIAIAGDTVRYNDNIFYVKGRNLPLGYLADDVIGRFTADRGDVIAEESDGRKYPVRFKQSPDITLPGLETPVRHGHALVARDSRIVKDFASVIRAGSILGRVEGILFSPNVCKIGMDASGDLE